MKLHTTLGVYKTRRYTNYAYNEIEVESDLDLLRGIDILEIEIYNDGEKRVTLFWDSRKTPDRSFLLTRVYLKRKSLLPDIRVTVKKFGVVAQPGEIVEKSKKIFDNIESILSSDDKTFQKNVYNLLKTKTLQLRSCL